MSALRTLTVSVVGLLGSAGIGWAVDKMFDDAPVWVPPLVFVVSFAAVMGTFLMADKFKSNGSSGDSASSENITSNRQSGGQAGHTIQNVTSNNQTGGITAHTVNVEGRPPRKMTEDLARFLLDQTSPGEHVEVGADTSVEDAEALSEEAADFLRANGRTVELFNYMQAGKHPEFWTIPTENGKKIMIGRPEA